MASSLEDPSQGAHSVVLEKCRYDSFLALLEVFC